MFIDQEREYAFQYKRIILGEPLPFTWDATADNQKLREMSAIRKKAICILGMHRSGTSAFARAINLLGAYIGRSDQLMPSQEDNPNGFWEHMAFYSFHERLLGFLSRSWDCVLPMPDEWWKNPKLGVKDGYIVNRALTPFAYYSYDDYEPGK